MSYWTEKRTLVTGGAGFIGSYLTEQLVLAGAQVRVADNFETGRIENLESVASDIELLELDLRNLPEANRACQGQEVVFNLAARITGIGYSRAHHAELFETNMLLQQNVLHAAHRQGVAKLCQVSSACVYPADAAVPTPELEGLRSVPEPENAGYGWAKRMGENLAAYYSAETDIEVVVARLFNAYGARDHFDAEKAHVIPALIKKVLDGSDPVEVWGNGEQTRSFVHARDLAKGIRLLVEMHNRAEAVNIGNDQETSIRSLIELIQDMTGIRKGVFYDISMPVGYLRRASDITKLREVTGFVPAIPLEEGLREMIDWYRANGSGNGAHGTGS